ncbi:MAG: hypothetical protein H6852_01220 [Geminicoccaceae bacterium]|nr:hypothetical protein [Geminicoccaceae bacterium]MCB9966239.1 hypothetical protein [Geminicoccaceae bacterium]HRW60951.1 hypothetical protein [Defluviicoccus sp.]
MRILNGIVGIALLGVGSVALAGEPVRLDAASLDSVTAGLWNGFALAITSPATARGASIKAFQGSLFQTEERLTATPSAFSGDFQALAISQTYVKASGIGTTSASGGGGVYTGVFAR